MNGWSVLPILVSLCLPFSAFSGQEAESGAGVYKLHINGLSIHFDKDENDNEKNWGVGIQRSLGRSESDTSLWDGWDLFWEVDVYKDSFSGLGWPAGWVPSDRCSSTWIGASKRGSYSNGVWLKTTGQPSCPIFSRSRRRASTTR